MKKIARIIISSLYILWGIGAPLSAWNALVELNVAAMISAAVGIIMLLAGICGLLGIKPLKRRLFGLIILALSLVSVVTSLKGGIQWQPILSAVMAFLYIIG